MATPLDAHAIAFEMKTAQDAAQSLEPFTTRLPEFNLATAYEVAHLIHRERVKEGARPVGRKIGFTNPDMWARFGVREPVWAYLYDRSVVYLSETRTTCGLGGLVEPRIEPEIVFGFRTTPRPEAELPEIMEAIEWVAHGFEIVQSHFPGWKFQAADTVADSALHGTLLIGPRYPLHQIAPDPAAALKAFTLTLSRGDQAIETAQGANVLGSPLLAISHLQSVLARQPDSVPLQAGEIVTTGTITSAYAISPGEVWSTKLQGIALPDLTVGFSA